MVTIRRARRFCTALVLAALATGFPAPRALAAGTSTIDGTAFQDLNRNGTKDGGEAPYEGHRVYLYDGAGTYLAWVATDASGSYRFGNLADGSYRVEYAPTTWWALRDTWVPTTTGSIRPTRALTLTGQGRVDFGWRPITTSTDVNAPISQATATNGLRAASYNDVVSAQEILDTLLLGRLIGTEAQFTTIRFAYSGSSSCANGVAQRDGVYTDFVGTCYIAYASWLDDGDHTLFHEYGHAWGDYHASVVQQDPQLSSYLAARGLTGDPRLDTSHAWDRHEILAEDYRHLFGSTNARLGGEMNTDIPLASQVPNLENFLTTTFRSPPANGGGGGGTPPPPPPPPPPPTPTSAHITDLDGRAVSGRSGQWTGEATATVQDNLGARVTSAKVSFTWVSSKGQSGTGTCTTGSTGTCAALTAAFKGNIDSVRFTVTGLTATGLSYSSGANTDPDGDSTGTVLVVARPA